MIENSYPVELNSNASGTGRTENAAAASAPGMDFRAERVLYTGSGPGAQSTANSQMPGMNSFNSAATSAPPVSSLRGRGRGTLKRKQEYDPQPGIKK